MKKIFYLLVAVGLFSGSASAHHSHSGFDLNRVIAFQGEVVEFEWTNPHVYLTIADDNGEEWLIETDPTPVMSRSGWSKESFSPGDTVTVRANPDRRAGATHGLLVSIQGVDGNSMLSWNTSGQDTYAGPKTSAASLEGIWQGERSSLKNFVLEMSTHPLTAKGEAARASYSQALNPTLECIGWPTPFVLSSYLYLSEIELGEEVVIFRNEFYGTVRTIYMDTGTSPPPAERSLQGRSVGHWEGETLVVETGNFMDHRSPYGSATGIPSGAQKHVVERYRLSSDGSEALIDIFLEDPEFLAEPVTATFKWKHSPQFEMLKLDCDENIATRFIKNGL